MAGPHPDNDNQPQPTQSLGAQRVRESFNPSGVGTVDKLKRWTADLIDKCAEEKDKSTSELPPHVRGEAARLWSLAMTAYEEAAMWAVKAATISK